MSKKTLFHPTKQFILLIFLLVLLPILVLAAQVAVKFFGKATGVPANIVVDSSSDLGTISAFWQAFAQGGEEKGRMLEPVVPEIKALSPKYIRLDHIYDLYHVVKPAAGGTVTYDWSALDNAVTDIIKTGARPFLSLSYMPTELAKNDIVGPPADWGQWENLVKATIEHYSGKGLGQKYLSDVYYEVWNEPDLFGKWKTYGERNYLELYKYSIYGAQRAQNVWPFKIGGPATTGLYKDWIENFLQYIKANNLRLDFLSYHHYSKRPEEFNRDLTSLTSWLTEFSDFKSVPIVISEWGSDPENSSWHDSLVDAVHFLASIRQMMQKVALAFTFEIKDGPGKEEYWGRWGFLTHEKFGKHKKPKYYAVQFLNQLEGSRLEVSGEGSWVTGVATKKDKDYMLLLVNFDPGGSHTESVPISFINLPSGNYLLKTQWFLDKQQEENLQIITGKWERKIFMPVQSALLLTLTKLSDVYNFVPGVSGQTNDLALNLSLGSQLWVLSSTQFTLGQTGSLDFFLKTDWGGQDPLTIFSLPFGNNQSLALKKKTVGFGTKLEFGVFDSEKGISTVSVPLSDWQKQKWYDVKLSWKPNALAIVLDGKSSEEKDKTINFAYFGDLTFNNFGGAIDNLKISEGERIILQRNFDGDVIK